MAEPRTIYCPKCGRKVATWDGRSSINVATNCKLCKKRVVFYVDTMKTELKDIPIRAGSSGKVLY